jgi:hypothetical protein
MSQDNININVTENIDEVNIVASEIVEVVDLNLYATTEDVTINVTEDIIQVNVNKVTATEQIQSDWNQTNTDALDFIKNKPTIPEAITNTSELVNDGADGVNPFITLQDIPAPITIDAVPTDGSSNAVSSNGVFDALANKQNSLGFTPENVANKASTITASATQYPSNNAVIDFDKNATFTIELIALQNVNFYAPGALRINTITPIFASPTTTLKVNDVAYTLGALISQGAKITVEVNIASVVNLIGKYE